MRSPGSAKPGKKFNTCVQQVRPPRREAGEMKMQTLTSIVQWSAVAIAVFIGLSALTVGTQVVFA
jgi:hypothetical protein